MLLTTNCVITVTVLVDHGAVSAIKQADLTATSLVGDHPGTDG